MGTGKQVLSSNDNMITHSYPVIIIIQWSQGHRMKKDDYEQLLPLPASISCNSMLCQYYNRHIFSHVCCRVLSLIELNCAISFACKRCTDEKFKPKGNSKCKGYLTLLSYCLSQKLPCPLCLANSITLFSLMQSGKKLCWNWVPSVVKMVKKKKKKGSYFWNRHLVAKEKGRKGLLCSNRRKPTTSRMPCACCLSKLLLSI